MSTPNQSLLEVQNQLFDTLAQLRSKLEAETRPEVIQALAHEIIEVDHRITLVGRLLFSQATAKITQAAGKVGDAKKAVDTAIADIAKIKNVLNTISGFLAAVDKVIDLAKLL